MGVDLTFLGKHVISGEIVCETGLHIGGSTEGFEIGGVENPVIRDPLTERPYIPGSSLKGKLRHLLEWSLGAIEEHPKHGGYAAHFCGECDACVLFGAASDDTDVRMKAGPSRLTVRDAFPTRETLDKWRTWLGEGIYTELKTENMIDRVTSKATPRPMERVPARSIFDFEMIFDNYHDDDVRLLRSLFTAMRLLENSALGGSGSRGHGQVCFKKLSVEYRPLAYYQNGTGAVPIQLPGKKDLRSIVADFDSIDWRG
jgi:CRISPR-associated protein Csm3